MRDCENVDVRDRLPELLHERLRGAERERVLAHVRECADCAAELALLRAARTVMASTAPRVDAAVIAHAVRREIGASTAARAPAPALVPPSTSPALRRPRRVWRSVPLRAAAATLVMALGAGGVLVARRDAAVVPRVAPPASSPSASSPSASSAPVAAVAAARTPTVAATPTPRADAPAPSPAAGGHQRVEPVAGGALGATFSDLSAEELAVVLRAIDETDGSLPADPAPTPAIVTPEGGL